MVSNSLCWVDIPVIDLNRACAFYSALFDKTIEKVDTNGFVFGLLPHENDNVAGCLSVIPDRQPSQHGPLIYLNVEDRMNGAIAAVSEHGGRVVADKQQIGPYGFRAIIEDTEGNVIALYSSKG